jgi:hypothetical protein
MPQFVLASQLQGSSATVLVIFVVVIFGAMIVVSYFFGKSVWRANTPKHPRATPPPVGTGVAVLTVIRSWNPVGGNAAFRVIMDDHEIAMLVPGRTRSARVVAGPHDLHVEAYGRQISDSVHLDLHPGEEVRIRCSPGGLPRPRPGAKSATWVRLVPEAGDTPRITY